MGIRDPRTRRAPRHGADLRRHRHDVGDPAVTAHRILATMTEGEYLALDESSGRYSHGPAITRITNDVLDLRARFRDLAQTYLHELVERTGETANLAILDGLEASYLDQVHTSRMLRAQTYLRVPLDCSGTGKVLLAFQSDAVREAILRRLTLQRRTEHARERWPSSDGAWPRSAKPAIGLDDEEMELGVRCIAAPLMVNQDHRRRDLDRRPGDSRLRRAPRRTVGDRARCRVEVLRGGDDRAAQPRVGVARRNPPPIDRGPMTGGGSDAAHRATCTGHRGRRGGGDVASGGCRHAVRHTRWSQHRPVRRGRCGTARCVPSCRGTSKGPASWPTDMPGWRHEPG